MASEAINYLLKCDLNTVHFTDTESGSDSRHGTERLSKDGYHITIDRNGISRRWTNVTDGNSGYRVSVRFTWTDYGYDII